MLGCLGNLYESIESLNETYMQPNQNKDILLKPKASTQVSLLLPNVESATARQVYRCYGTSYTECRVYFADDPRAVCLTCGFRMTQPATYVAATPAANKDLRSGDQGGYVKGVVLYMVMDDLVVKPMSTISSITLLNKFNVKEVGALQEKEIHLGMDEGLKLLKASLQSKTVLTDVFLGKKRV